MTNKEVIEKFYTAFSNGNVEEMINCYHDDIQFEDPVFGKLKGQKAKAMWKMLLSRDHGLKITFDKVEASEKNGSAKWKAEYVYTQTGRKVVNRVSANFEFADGKIMKHIDHFNLYKWTRQALGWKGYIFGWTGFTKNKIQKKTNALLDLYIRRISRK